MPHESVEFNFKLLQTLPTSYGHEILNFLRGFITEQLKQNSNKAVVPRK